MNRISKKCMLLALAITASQTTTIVHAKTTYIPDGYNIETIKTPEGIKFDITGLDSNSNGDVFVATRLGDVWKYTTKGEWKKFAYGLHEPTGLLYEDDGSILVAQKPETTRLIDTNKDGVADDYIRVASGWDFHDNYHEYNFGPVKDKEGNYYGTLNLSHNLHNHFAIGAMGSGGGYRGFAYQINKKGEFVPYAWGLRSPAGIGSSPEGEIFYTDNQGDWVATSKMHLLEKGKFYGHPVSLRDVEGYTIDLIKQTKPSDLDKMREKPVVWIPHAEVANSPGNPEWDTTKGKFGPFAGQIFVGDQTQSNVFRVLLDKVNGKYQGAVINFIDGFQSGNIRVDFDQAGQLWLGQTARGWSAKGGKPFGLQKVVWDGTLPFELHNIKLTKQGFKLNFTKPVDVDSAVLTSFTAKQWHYNYSQDYGSPKVDEKAIPIKSVKISANKKEVEVILPLTADKVVHISFDGIRDASGKKPSTTQVYYTLNNTLD